MRLLIFGATGGTGRILVDKALAAGHDVVAYVRNPDRLPTSHDRLRVVQGHLSDAAAISESVRGVDAVITVLSQPVFGGPKDLPIASGSRAIVAAMHEHGVRRLVYCWGPSISQPHHTWNRPLAAILAIIRLLPNTQVFTDEAVIAGETVRSSGLDWTIVTVARPVDRPATGRLKVRTASGVGDKVGMGATSREDLADFLLQQASDTRFTREELLISN